MESYYRHILKEIASNAIYYFGGIYLLKKMLPNQRTLIILNYHNFSKYNNYKIKRGNILETGYAKNFEKQMKFLKKHFNFCYPEEFVNGNCKKGINLLITFDDGYKDNYDIAAPILKKYDASAIFFIATNCISSNCWLWHDKLRYLAGKGLLNQAESELILKRMNEGHPIDSSYMNFINEKFPAIPPKRMMMNWDEVQKLQQIGFKIGNHTSSHKTLSFLDYKEQKREIESSQEVIKQKLKIKTNLFAFPNGLFNNNTFKILKKNGFKYSFTTNSGTNNKSQNKLQLMRIGINASDSKSVLLLKILKA